MARKDSKNPNSKGKVDVKKILKPILEPSDKLKNKKF